MSLPTKSSPEGRPGAVLLIMLGMIMIMSWIALEIVAGVRRDLNIRSSPPETSRLRQTAYHLLEVTFGVLNEIRVQEGGLYSPVQGWGDPLYYADIEPGPLPAHLKPRNADAVTPQPTDSENLPDLLQELLFGEDINGETTLVDTAVPEEEHSAPVLSMAFDENTVPLGLPPGISARITITDESGRLSLTATSEERWKLFFQTMGFESSESNILAESLLDWMDADDRARPHGAESEAYRQRDPPYDAANRPLRDFDELWLIQGFDKLFFDDRGIPNEHFHTFVECVSLYHTDEPNFNTAPRLVLETLAEEQGFEWERVDEFLAGQDRLRGTRDDPVLYPGMDTENIPLDRDGNPIRVDRQANVIKIKIMVTAGMEQLTLSAIIDLRNRHPNGIYPFQIISVLENLPLT